MKNRSKFMWFSVLEIGKSKGIEPACPQLPGGGGGASWLNILTVVASCEGREQKSHIVFDFITQLFCQESIHPCIHKWINPFIRAECSWPTYLIKYD